MCGGEEAAPVPSEVEVAAVGVEAPNSGSCLAALNKIQI